MKHTALGLLFTAMAASATAQDGALPADGGAPGHVYREFMKAAGARDWRTLHRVTTPAFFAGLTQELLAGTPAELPPRTDIVVRGTRQGNRATMEVEIRTHPRPGVTNSSSAAAFMVLDKAQWKVARSETDPPTSPVSFEAAETVRRMRELGGHLDGLRASAGLYPKATTIADLSRALASETFKEPYTDDAWGNPFVYRLHETRKEFVLLSYGRGGTPEAGRYDAKGVPKAFEPDETVEPEADLIITSGQRFVRYPRGAIIE